MIFTVKGEIINFTMWSQFLIFFLEYFRKRRNL